MKTVDDIYDNRFNVENQQKNDFDEILTRNASEDMKSSLEIFPLFVLRRLGTYLDWIDALS
jgi:hypothetical protein